MTSESAYRRYHGPHAVRELSKLHPSLFPSDPKFLQNCRVVLAAQAAGIQDVSLDKLLRFRDLLEPELMREHNERLVKYFERRAGRPVPLELQGDKS